LTRNLPWGRSITIVVFSLVANARKLFPDSPPFPFYFPINGRNSHFLYHRAVMPGVILLP
jgi:hypothetical protein